MYEAQKSQQHQSTTILARPSQPSDNRTQSLCKAATEMLISIDIYQGLNLLPSFYYKIALAT